MGNITVANRKVFDILTSLTVLIVKEFFILLLRYLCDNYFKNLKVIDIYRIFFILFKKRNFHCKMKCIILLYDKNS